MDTIFDAFEKGTLCFPETTDFDAVPWSATGFEGVALKHIVTGAQTGGQFSFHLVRIAPDKCIGRHVHATQLETHEVVGGSGQCTTYAPDGARTLDYATGTVAFFASGLAHEVVAGTDGLCLFAKFFPALC